ncbi:MAG: ABC transporter ATP-binding protein [Chloroflexi bacterium]|nr:ABC transporter ATP-binding protein [Chloroflexota bacterium]
MVALDNVSFIVGDGEWLSIMGPSGSGKTTLLNLIAGLDTPTSGQIIVRGKEISAISHNERARFRREAIGIIFQQFHLIPYLTTLENIMLAQYLHSLPDQEEALAALRLIGLEDRANHLASKLSGGEQQRVAIARAMINDPYLLLADEPTGNLDAKNEEIVLNIFKKLKNEGKTIIIVTHNPEVAEIGDRTIRLHHGRVSEIEGISEAV